MEYDKLYTTTGLRNIYSVKMVTDQFLSYILTYIIVENKIVTLF